MEILSSPRESPIIWFNQEKDNEADMPNESKILNEISLFSFT